MRLDHLLSKELYFSPTVVGLFVWLMSPSVRLPQVLNLPGGDTPSGHGCTVWMVVRLACDGCAAAWCLVGGCIWLRDKRVFMLVHCWVSGAALGCSCWALMLAGRVGCGWLCVGVVLCENCIVDASIFLFCVLVFIP